jgi:hypothetical protein
MADTIGVFYIEMSALPPVNALTFHLGYYEQLFRFATNRALGRDFRLSRSAMGQAPVDEQCSCGGEPQATRPVWE